MNVFVLLFRDASGNEGIHTLSVGDQNIVLMFEDEDDATRYALLLEAQDFMTPSVESIERQEIEDFCEGASYQAKLVPQGFVPESDADRLMIVPPTSNLEQTDWEQGEEESEPGGDRNSGQTSSQNNASNGDDSGEGAFLGGDLDDIRRRLEGLL